MRPLPLALAVSLAIPAGSLAAQATRDHARLVFNVGLGYAGGTDLWEVTGQRLTDDSSLPARTDLMNVSREVGPTLTFGLKGIYFRGDHFGLLGEAYFLGLGLRDACSLTSASGSGRNAEVCARINGAERSASAVQVATGVIYRVNSRRVLSPYGRATIGLLASNRSSVALVGAFTNPDNQLVDVDVYPEPNSTRVSPTATLALGMTAALAPGYQVRWEVRDNIVGMREVTGVSQQDGILPPTAQRFHHLFALEVGFDVVLERRRGRRY
jgi:hypothetical protein